MVESDKFFMIGEVNVSVMNGFVQTLVWATMIGFVYLLWLNKQTTSPLRVFEQTRHLKRVLNSLQNIWIVVVLSVIVSAFLVSLPPLAQVASRATPLCAVSTPLQTTVQSYAYRSFSAVCTTSEPTPSRAYPASEDSGDTAPSHGETNVSSIIKLLSVL